jgi:hypothetical protein
LEAADFFTAGFLAGAALALGLGAALAFTTFSLVSFFGAAFLVAAAFVAVTFFAAGFFVVVAFLATAGFSFFSTTFFSFLTAGSFFASFVPPEVPLQI